MIELHWSDDFKQKYLMMTLSSILISRNMERRNKFKIVKLVKFASKATSSHFLSSITLIISFKDLILAFNIWVLYTTIDLWGQYGK